jgi:hypothetical protein
VNTAVIIIDNDLGFAFWLGRALDRFGYEAFPARSAADALALLSHIPTPPRLLIFGGASSEFQTLIDRCRQREQDLTVLWLTDDDPAAYNQHHKPARGQDDELAELLLDIEEILACEPEAVAGSFSEYVLRAG